MRRISKQKWWALLCLVAAFTTGCNKEQMAESEGAAAEQAVLTPGLMERLENLLAYPIDSTTFPRSMDAGAVRGVGSSDWTSGFLPGSLWYAYRLTDSAAFKEKAATWTRLVEKEKWNDRTHDMGFKVYSSFGKGYEITANEQYKDVIIQSAKTLSTRYNPRVGSLRSWDFNKDQWSFPVIIDNMMNLELLFETTRLTGDSTYYNIAYQHALTTLQNHFRADNSSYHVVDYNPLTGAVDEKVTHQGINDESSWARGQAWGLYGFTMAYRYTQDERFLEQAKKVHDFMFQHANKPENGIFYWDFDDPAIPNAPRDASAAAIAASALLELYKYDPQEKYLKEAESILSSLASSEYMLEESNTGPFILDHSTGNMPKNDEVDVPIAYADYYFLEALWRKQQIAQN
jgi:unsaturated chondroitin disaccharide hydrolase